VDRTGSSRQRDLVVPIRIVEPRADRVVARTVDLEEDAVRRPPAVDTRPAARSGRHDLHRRSWQPGLLGDAQHRHLVEGLRSVVDVEQRLPDDRSESQVRAPVERRAYVGGAHDPLLDGRCKDAVRSALVPRGGRHLQYGDGGTEPRRLQRSHDVRAKAGSSAVAHALDRGTVSIREGDVDDRALEPRQPGELGCSRTAQDGARPACEHRHPDPLVASQRTGVCNEDAFVGPLPAPGVDAPANALRASCRHLPSGNDARLLSQHGLDFGPGGSQRRSPAGCRTPLVCSHPSSVPRQVHPSAVQAPICGQLRRAWAVVRGDHPGGAPKLTAGSTNFRRTTALPG
jgi:hypothetical protein